MDERLTLLDRTVRKGDGAALTELVGRLERLLAAAEVEARITDLVDEADLDSSVWMPAIVGAFGVERFRSTRALTFDRNGKRGPDVDELQFERHGASFGLRPGTASLLVIDDDDREVSYASDVTPALLLRLLRDRARLDLDLDVIDVTGVADPFEVDDRFLEECAALDLARDGALLGADAPPLRLVLAHEPGPAAAGLRGVRLDDWPGELAQGIHFEAGDGLPRRLYTAFDLLRCSERVGREARRLHRSRGDLDTFLGWTIRIERQFTVEVEPFEAGFGSRVSLVETCFDDCGVSETDEGHDVTVTSPLRATAAEVLADVLSVREGGGMRGEVGWTDSHEQHDEEEAEDEPERGGAEEDDDDDRLDVGSARDD